MLNLTLGRDAKIYYGQELGMRGREITGTGSDGGHIPLREAFRWKADLAAPGSAIWQHRAPRFGIKGRSFGGHNAPILPATVFQFKSNRISRPRCLASIAIYLPYETNALSFGGDRLSWGARMIAQSSAIHAEKRGDGLL